MSLLASSTLRCVETLPSLFAGFAPGDETELCARCVFVQSVNESVLIGDSLGYQSLNARSAKVRAPTLQQHTQRRNRALILWTLIVCSFAGRTQPTTEHPGGVPSGGEGDHHQASCGRTHESQLEYRAEQGRRRYRRHGGGVSFSLPVPPCE